MRGTALTELNEKYKDCPVRTSRYFVDGKEYRVHTQIRKIHAQTASPRLTAMFNMVSYPKLNKKSRKNRKKA